MMKFKDLLFHPDRFFAGLLGEDENLIPPFLIVALGAAITIVTMGIRLFFGYYPNTSPQTLISWSFWYIISPFLLWGFVSLVIYLIASGFSGKGTFQATLQNMGFGLFPWTLSTVVELGITVLFFREPQSVYYGAWQSPHFVNGIIYVIFMIWACYLWIFAIKRTHQLSLGKAVASVLSLVIVALLSMYTMTFVGIFFPNS